MHITKIQIRFRDTDRMGHVNNAVFLTYLELARITFFEKLHKETGIDLDFILARVEIDFTHQMLYQDKPEVHLWVKKIGNSSFTTAYKIVDSIDPNKIYAKATSVQVVFNYRLNKKEIISEDVRNQLLHHQDPC